MLETTVQGETDPRIGKVLLDRYRLKSVIGQGGMGKVYLAEQKMGTAMRDVAIKALRRDLTGEPETIARFYRECETVIQLHHPNTVRFYDFGELEDGTLFIVMEYIDGESLGHALKRGPINPERSDHLVIQICGSLQEAHTRGIIHRDLKPENILLTEQSGQDDFVKVLDFGIAKSAAAPGAEANTLTRQGTVLGTPPYMSPEQFGDDAVGPASDIYALGVLTYEMLTGRLPFDAKTPWEWATHHLTSEPREIEDIVAESRISDEKKATIMRALSKKPEDRQASILEFMLEFTGIEDAKSAWTVTTGGFRTQRDSAEDLERPRPPQAPITGLERTEEIPTVPPRRSRRRWVALAAAIAAIAGASLWWQSRTMERTEPSPPATPDVTLGPNFEEPNTPPPAAEPPPSVIAPPPEPELPAPEPPAVEPETAPKVKRPSTRATVTKLLRQGQSALDRKNFATAAGKVRQAARIEPRSDRVRQLRGELERQGGHQVASYLLQNKCSEAQKLYKQLKRAGAAAGARRHFPVGDCRLP